MWRRKLVGQFFNHQRFQRSFSASNSSTSSSAASAASASSQPPLLTLYQYQICPFCNRVKAFLDYNKFKYQTVEVNPTSKKEIAFSGLKKVPIVSINNHIIDDSMKIIEYLRDSSTNKIEIQQLWTDDTEKWVQWSEVKLARLLYPNITRTFGDSWKAFQYCEQIQTWSPLERFTNRYLGPVAMYLATFKIKKKYGIVDERRELNEVLIEWTNALGSNKFINGNNITLPDLMVYGVLRGIEELPTFPEIMKGNSSLEQWYNNVKASINR